MRGGQGSKAMSSQLRRTGASKHARRHAGALAQLSQDKAFRIRVSGDHTRQRRYPELVRVWVGRDLFGAWAYKSSCQGGLCHQTPRGFVLLVGFHPPRALTVRRPPPSSTRTTAQRGWRGWRGWSLTGGCDPDCQRSVLCVLAMRKFHGQKDK